METYGYSKRRKVYDPDYEHVENAKFREYERLEGGGYDDSVRDADHDKPRQISAPGLGAEQLGPESNRPGKFTTSDYIVPPKVPQILQGLNAPRARSMQESEKKEEELTAFELPPEIANPQTSPCVNVPEWFVKEGGELSLSDTASGKSVLRYWPKFLSEKGNHHMFNRLRKYCKWHQKQAKIGGDWKYETRLVAWYGPCDFEHSGLTLEKNSNWAPELLDLLDRLKSTTREEFNSCLLNLYRHGHDMCTWCSLQHVQMGRSPPIAFVTVGQVRVLELRKKAGKPNFIRFPLFPGSLLLMTGATQEDWLHSVPRDPIGKEETICLTFRIMYSINRRVVD
jgi:alkylated DNA repair dioxygenase AlkB